MAAKDRKRSRKPREPRADGRQQFLSYLQPEVVRRLKIAAMDRRKPAYLIVEEAVTGWLDGQPKKD
jgi:hypothetical protein